MAALGLQAGQDPQGLGIALEATDVITQLVQRPLAIVAERRMSEIVGQAGHLDQVPVAPEGRTEFAADLSHLEGVGEPVAHEVVTIGGEHLRLGSQPPQRGGMDEATAVAGEIVTIMALRRRILRDPALPSIEPVCRPLPRAHDSLTSGFGGSGVGDSVLPVSGLPGSVLPVSVLPGSGIPRAARLRATHAG